MEKDGIEKNKIKMGKRIWNRNTRNTILLYKKLNLE